MDSAEFVRMVSGLDDVRTALYSMFLVVLPTLNGNRADEVDEGVQ